MTYLDHSTPDTSRIEKTVNRLDQLLIDYYSGLEEDSDSIRLHSSTLGKDELLAFAEAYLEGCITFGKYNGRLQKLAKDAFNTKFCLTSNSGSSANLLAISGLIQSGRLKVGDIVAVPALAWSTTVFPLVQYGLVPLFIDIDCVSFNICLDGLRSALGEYDVKALMLIHTYGNPVDMDAILEICSSHNLVLIEDTCESMGATWLNRPVGSFGDIGTFSMYYSHHICTLEGGLTVTNDEELCNIMTSIRSHGWTRGANFDVSDLQEAKRIDPTFMFLYLGYNLRLSDPQAAIGCIQMTKLGEYCEARLKNAETYISNILHSERLSKHIIYQSVDKRAVSSWFGFPILMKHLEYEEIIEMKKFMLSKGIETRPFLAGNFCRQPVSSRFNHLKHKLVNIDLFHEHSLALPCHQGMSTDSIHRICDTINEYLAKFKNE